MARDEVSIGLMDLADLAQPRKIAWEIHRRLRSQFGSVPLQISLEAIAAATGIVSIEDFETDRFEGMADPASSSLAVLAFESRSGNFDPMLIVIFSIDFYDNLCKRLRRSGL